MENCALALVAGVRGTGRAVESFDYLPYSGGSASRSQGIHLQTPPPWADECDARQVANAGGFSLHTSVATEVDDRQKLRRGGEVDCLHRRTVRLRIAQQAREVWLDVMDAGEACRLLPANRCWKPLPAAMPTGGCPLGLAIVRQVASRDANDDHARHAGTIMHNFVLDSVWKRRERCRALGRPRATRGRHKRLSGP